MVKQNAKGGLMLCMALLFICFNVKLVSAQDPYGKITLTGGGPQFIVVSLNDYNNGIQLNNWSKVRIVFNATDVLCTGWELRIRTTDANLISDDGNSNISLSLIKVVPVNIVSDPADQIVSENAAFALSNAGDWIIRGNKKVSVEVTLDITYRLGKDPAGSLINIPHGFYYTKLEFNLISLGI